MPGKNCHSIRAAAAAVSFAVAIVCFTAATFAADPLLASIPSRRVTTAALLEQSAIAVEQIAWNSERIRVLARILFDLRDMPEEDLKPLLDILRRETGRPENLLSIIEHADALRAAAPIVLPLARQLTDEKRRDHSLCLLSQSLQDTDLAKRVVREIKDPPSYALAQMQFASRSQSLEEAKECLAEAKRVGWPPYRGSQGYTYGRALARFAPERLDDVVAYIRSELAANDAVEALGVLAADFDTFHKLPATAAKLFKDAAALVPTCTNPMAAVNVLNRYGYVKHFPLEATELFDRFIPAAAGWGKMSASITALAPAGLDAVVARGDHFAPVVNGTTWRHVAPLIASVSWQTGPDPVLAWLQDQPPSPLREAVIASLATTLDYESSRRGRQGGRPAVWVEQLIALHAEIRDPDARRETGQNLLRFARQASLDVPQSIHDDWLNLFREYTAGLEDDRRQDEINSNFELLPEVEQRIEIERQFAIPELPRAANLVRRSSLSPVDKKTLFARLLKEVGNIKTAEKKAAALSGLGGDLWEFDPDGSLSCLFESLSLARWLALKPIGQNIDDGPGYHGWRYPPTTADEAIEPVLKTRGADLDQATAAIWALARRLDNEEDRDAVLAALGKRLVLQREYEKAAGVTFLLLSPPRRAVLFAAVAVEQSGHALPE